MDSASEAILALKPVTFHYKSDTTNTPQFGLIAEDVAEINPDLVVRNEKGEIHTVRLDAGQIAKPGVDDDGDRVVAITGTDGHEPGDTLASGIKLRLRWVACDQ